MPKTIENGPPCAFCGEPQWVTTITRLDPPRMPNGEVNEFGRAYVSVTSDREHVHHECAREPSKQIAWLLTRIGSWTNARWDQHLRNEFGDVAANAAIEFLRDCGIKASEK